MAFALEDDSEEILCLLQLSPNHDVHKTLHEIATLSFKPTSRKREAWLLRETASQLVLPGSAKLPPELKFEISQYMTRQYATALLGSLTIHHPVSDAIDISTPLALQYVRYEGQHYVSRAEKSPRKVATTPTIMYISETPHGIRNFFVSRTGVPPAVNEVADLWWKILSIKNEHPKVRVDSDVSEQTLLTQGAPY